MDWGKAPKSRYIHHIFFIPISLKKIRSSDSLQFVKLSCIPSVELLLIFFWVGTEDRLQSTKQLLKGPIYFVHWKVASKHTSGWKERLLIMTYTFMWWNKLHAAHNQQKAITKTLQTYITPHNYMSLCYDLTYRFQISLILASPHLLWTAGSTSGQ